MPAAPADPACLVDPDSADAAAQALIAVAAARPPSAGGTRVVAIDGPSGSGKTVFAERVVDQLATLTGHRPQTVHMDDLYPGWHGLAASIPELVGRVLRPLAEGRPAGYQHYDWASGRYHPAVEPVDPAAYLVVEGVGCGSRACAPYLSALAWLDAPTEQRRARGLARDGETYAPHWDTWAAQEGELYGTERTRERADVVLDTGTPEMMGAWSPCR
ncbi:uridine kinase family protein [Arsenicicoccus piscis]|nr:hypothetical protein [Arsenicicoccus piscis]